MVNNHERLRGAGSSLVLYLPKIQTAEEAALWNEILTTLERFLELPVGQIKVYVLVEQLEAVYQLMEIRAALGGHFVGFNTGRWDYINSVADAMAWDKSFCEFAKVHVATEFSTTTVARDMLIRHDILRTVPKKLPPNMDLAVKVDASGFTDYFTKRICGE